MPASWFLIYKQYNINIERIDTLTASSFDRLIVDILNPMTGIDTMITQNWPAE